MFSEKVSRRLDDEANAAIEALNGKDVDGRQLTVNRAKERSR